MRIVAAGERGVERLVGIETQAGDAAISGFKLDQKLGKAVVARRAANQADVRRFFEDFLAFLLRHASEHRKRFPLAVFFLELLKAVEDFLLGLVADAARVVEDQLGFLGGRDLGITAPDEGADDLFGVVHIHLAPEGLDIECLHLFVL